MNTKIKNSACAVIAIMGSFFSMAQMDVNLSIQHHYNGQGFSYGTDYVTEAGTAINFSRVQYYLCGFDLIHDGGQVTNLADSYVLGSGNVSSYPLGQSNISVLEGIAFDFGVDSVTNHMGTSFWQHGHPLASQSPTMDWSWPSGYFFFTITGMIDDNNDGIPNKSFELHGIGDHLFRDVDQLTGLNESGSNVDVTVYANVANWIKNIDLATVGFDHSGSANNVQVSDNTNDEVVFTLESTLNLEEIQEDLHHIYADYTLPYAPTIYYDLATTENVDIAIYDLNGSKVMEVKSQAFEGNFFVRKELLSGSYLMHFKNSTLEETYRFIVTQ